MLKSPTLIIGLLGLIVAVAWFAFGGWLSGVKPVPPAAAVTTLPASPLLPAVPVSQPGAPVVVPSTVHPIRIQGGMSTKQGGETVWLWVSDEGRLMTEDEIAGESGGTVSSRMVRGVRVLTGTGVIYGGTRADAGEATNLLERVAPERAVSPAPAVSATSVGPSVPGPSHDTPAPDPSPPIPHIPTHPGILATPPGLL